MLHFGQIHLLLLRFPESSVPLSRTSKSVSISSFSTTTGPERPLAGVEAEVEADVCEIGVAAVSAEGVVDALMVLLADETEFFPRKESSAVFLFPVCNVGKRGFFGDGFKSVAGAGTGECDRDRLPSGFTTSSFGTPAAKNPSIPRWPSSNRSRPEKDSAI